jgi:class 3 adenylate cyclase/tetratricopeptide (TPR) repeat protein
VADQVADRLVEGGGTLPEERRLITALFADVSGFTSLADRLDPEQLLEVIDPVISGLSSIVGRYEGYVEKFAGDALLALFGAPVTHEDDPIRALRVALEMHAELAHLCAELPYQAELTLHVGVNSGHGIARILGSEARMDYAVLGDSVILAQRLESAAPPGETYVSEMTMRLAQDHFEFEPVGELTLKGKREPVPAWRLIGQRQRGRIAAAKPSTALVGRDEELAELTKALDALVNGAGACIAVTGEPGVGKSRLTTAARSHAEHRGFRWLEGRCVSYGAGLAYWPYLEVLRDFAGIRADDVPEPASARLASALDSVGAADSLPFLARLLGLRPHGMSDEVAAMEPEALRRALHDAFSFWAKASARERPTVISIEDAHWADASSVALSADLATLCANAPIVLYLTARREGEQVLAEVASERISLRLEPLGERAVDALIEGILGARPPSGLAQFVARRTAGNPFFVEEIVRSLRETNVLVREGEHWAMRPGWDDRTLPTTVEEVLSARIDSLPRAAANVLQTAAVIGRRVLVRLLQEVADDIPDLAGTLDQLVTGTFLDRVDEDGESTLSFHHALVQDAAYSRILRRRRRELHRKVAEVAEALYGAGEDSIDLLARHLYLGEGGPKALDYLVRAGERAARLFANDEAILHFKRAAEVAGEEAAVASRLPEIQLSLAELEELVGAYDEAIALYCAVRDATTGIRAWCGIASTLRKQGKYAEALKVVDEAFAHEGLEKQDLTPLWLEQGRTLSVAGRTDQAIDVLEAGLAAAPSAATPGTARLLFQLARAETVERRLDEAIAHGLAAVEILEREQDLRGLTNALRIVGDAYARSGRRDDAIVALRRGLALAERTGNAEETAGCLLNLAAAQGEDGSLTEAIASARRAISEFERIGHTSGRAQGYSCLAHMLAQSGEYGEALLSAEKAVELARAIGNKLAVADVSDTIAFVRLKTGGFQEAAAQAEDAADLYLEVGAVPQAAATLEIAVEAWERAGDMQRARVVGTRARELTALVSSD